jgi:hypothetical protein
MDDDDDIKWQLYKTLVATASTCSMPDGDFDCFQRIPAWQVRLPVESSIKRGWHSYTMKTAIAITNEDAIAFVNVDWILIHARYGVCDAFSIYN